MNNKEVLADRIVVYRNAIPNREEIIKNIKKDQYWEKWYDVGKQIIVTNSNEFAFNDFPDKKT
jgi:antitoxin component YwqK of YwqJK toxin-antitoxin module